MRMITAAAVALSTLAGAASAATYTVSGTLSAVERTDNVAGTFASEAVDGSFSLVIDIDETDFQVFAGTDQIGDYDQTLWSSIDFTLTVDTGTEILTRDTAVDTQIFAADYVVDGEPDLAAILIADGPVSLYGTGPYSTREWGFVAYQMGGLPTVSLDEVFALIGADGPVMPNVLFGETFYEFDGTATVADWEELYYGTVTSVVGPSPVPLPAGGWLLLAGLGLLGVARRV